MHLKKLIMMLTILCSGFGAFTQNPRNVVLYDLTSTDCGHCSCMDSIIRIQILPDHPRTIPLALHSPLNSSFGHFHGNALFFMFHAGFAPSGFIDGLGYAMTWEVTPDSIDSRYAASPEAPVLVTVNTKTWDPGSRTVTLSTTMTNLGPDLPGNYRYQVFVTEDNIKGMHRTQEGCSTPDDPGGLPFRHNYFNDHVVRTVVFIPSKASASAWGDSVIGPVWPSGFPVTKTVSVQIDTAWVEANCYMNLVVYHDADSLYKSAVQQAISECVVGGIGVGEIPGGKPFNGITLIYPNPASGRVNIHLEVATAGIWTLTLIDMQGRVVETLADQWLEEWIYNIETLVTQLPAGTYLCECRYPGGESVARLVVQMP